MTAKIVEFEDDDGQDAVQAVSPFGPPTEVDWLIDPVEIPADKMPWDYQASGKKKVIYPQAGRTILILPVQAAETQLLLPKMMSGQALVEEGQRTSDTAKVQAGMVMVTEATERLTALLSRVLPQWDLIGWDRQMLPQPYNNPQVLMGLPNDALAWLSQSVGEVAAGTFGDTEEDRGNALRPSRPRSTARGRRQRA